jgi:hypothetical protein
MWARLEAETATFTPRRIAPGRGGSWRTVMAATAAIAMVVGAAKLFAAGSTVIGAAGAADPARASGATDPAQIVAARPPAVGRIEGDPGIVPVNVRTPTGREGAITGPAVPVDLELHRHAGSVRIGLETDRFHSIAGITIDTSEYGGELRPDSAPRYHVDLALPWPRPTGRLWVVVIAYDRSGHEIGMVRRAVLIGPAAGPIGPAVGP